MDQRLFSDKFPEINSDEKLQELCKKFPEYDPAYICQGSVVLRRKFKDWIEGLWKDFRPFADSQFPSAFKKDFMGRSWELYLGSTFLNRGYNLKRVGNKGPDLMVVKDDFYTYIEAISATSGTGPDKVPGLVHNAVGSVPSDEIQLRVANALSVNNEGF